VTIAELSNPTVIGRPANHLGDLNNANGAYLTAPFAPSTRARKSRNVRLFSGEGLPAKISPTRRVTARRRWDDRPSTRWGKVGKQRIEDTGPLTKKRMETCDDDFVAAAKDFIARQNKDGKPFFVWLNTTHMHMFTHTKKESLGQAGRWQSPYHDTMVDHDRNVGQMLDYLDELGITDDTFVMYSTDNGPHRNSWPDGGMTPFRSERIPTGKVHSVSRRSALAGGCSGSVSADRPLHPWLQPSSPQQRTDVVKKAQKGHTARRKFKNHIDGYNSFLPENKEKSHHANCLST
jgi:arylsulfatase